VCEMSALYVCVCVRVCVGGVGGIIHESGHTKKHKAYHVCGTAMEQKLLIGSTVVRAPDSLSTLVNVRVQQQ
jgi:hypothetical protein